MFTPDDLPNLLKEIEKFKETLAQQKIPSVWQVFDDANKAVQEVHDSLTDPQQKKMLSDLLGEATRAKKELDTTMPALLADLEKQQKETFANIEDLAGQLKKAEQDLETAQKAAAEGLAAPTSPSAPDLPVDADHGAGLAQELFQALGLLESLKKAHGEFQDGGSIARHWEETEGAEEGKAAAPAPAAPQPEAPSRSVLKPKTLRPLSRPPQPRPPAEPKPEAAEPSRLDESIGKMSFDDE